MRHSTQLSSDLEKAARRWLARSPQRVRRCRGRAVAAHVRRHLHQRGLAFPTKPLVHAAALSQAQGGTFAERAARYAAAIDEKDRVTGMLRAKNYHKIADLPNVDVIDGRASFVDATHLAIEMAVAEDRIRGNRAAADRGRPHLRQHGRTPLRAAHPRHRQPARVRERGAARPAHAARALRHHRWRVHRPRVRLHVRELRIAGHRRAGRRAVPAARGRRDSRRRAGQPRGARDSRRPRRRRACASTTGRRRTP